MEKYVVDTYTEKYTTGAAAPLSLDFLRLVSKAVCKIFRNEPDVSAAAGFLARFSSRSGEIVHGLFTNHHVLGSRKSDLADGNQIIVLFDAHSLKLCTTGLFRFTCSLLDATFVQFDQAAIETFKECHYLTLTPPEKELSEIEPVIVLEHQRGKEVHFTQGNFIEYYGLDLFHSACTDDGSSGSPVVLTDGTVVGIHKAHSKAKHGVAITMTAITRALLPFFDHPHTRVVFNPLALDKQYDTKISAQGLERFPTDHDLMYVSPANTFEGGIVTPIWFVPTSHGWYWTPTDPSQSDNEITWMPVCQLEVTGGFWHDEIPADKNVKIIQCLFANNISCGICPVV